MEHDMGTAFKCLFLGAFATYVGLFVTRVCFGVRSCACMCACVCVHACACIVFCAVKEDQMNGKKTDPGVPERLCDMFRASLHAFFRT